MARQNGSQEDYVRPIRRMAVGAVVVVLLVVFLVWRIDSPRAERFRAQIVDSIVPNWPLIETK